MKKVKRLFKMLSSCKNLDEERQEPQDLCAEHEEEKDDAAVSWWKRKQESIKEIFLICMTPYM